MTDQISIVELIEDIQAARERELYMLSGDKRVASVLDRAAKTIIAIQAERLKLSGVLASMLMERKNQGLGRRSDFGKPSPGRRGNRSGKK
jgi:hypothetical protein